MAKAVSKKKTYKAQLNELRHLYQKRVKDGPVIMREVASWAIRENLWKAPARSAVDLLARELSQAAREEYMTDLQGRRVRKMHARTMEVPLPTGELVQQTFWDDITTATPEHMHMAFQQRRRIVLNDCNQLKKDVDSYNDNWNQGEQLLISYDFSEDLEELSMPTDYSNSERDDDEGEISNET